MFGATNNNNNEQQQQHQQQRRWCPMLVRGSRAPPCRPASRSRWLLRGRRHPCLRCRAARSCPPSMLVREPPTCLLCMLHLKLMRFIRRVGTRRSWRMGAKSVLHVRATTRASWCSSSKLKARMMRARPRGKRLARRTSQCSSRRGGGPRVAALNADATRSGSVRASSRRRQLAQRRTQRLSWCPRHGRHRAHPHRGLCRCSPLRCTPLLCSPRARRGLKASRGIYRGPTLMRRPGQPRELPLIRALRSTQ